MIRVVEKLVLLLELVILFVLLFYHLKLGLVRYFDIDEFAHIHWAWNFFSGLRPYKDFLYFFPPGFLIFLWPLFLLSGGAKLLIGVRILQFGLFVILAVLLFLVAKKAANLRTAVLTAAIFAFLPLPFDKFIELRPDTLATVLSFVGIYFQILAVEKGKNFILAGFFLSLGVFILTKEVFFILPAILTVLIHIKISGKSIKIFNQFVLGLLIPAVFTLIFFVWTGNFTRAVFLTTKFASASAKILGEKFIMMPNLFFYPNDVYYGEPGKSLPLILNLSIYLIAAIWGIISFVSFLAEVDNKKAVYKFLLSATFILNLFAYIKFFPLKHAQYLIPVAPFAAYFFSDFVLKVGDLSKTKYFRVFYSLALIALLTIVLLKSIKMNEIKASWNNNTVTDSIRKNEAVRNYIPENEYVLDLTGETFSFKDPYYICCIPWGQYYEAFSFKVPDLARVLKATKTKYIYAGDVGREGVWPYLDQKFIREHYVLGLAYPAIYIPGREFKLIRGKEEDFDILISGDYLITFNGEPAVKEEIFIDGKAVAGKAKLFEGDHTIRSDFDGVVLLKLDLKQ